MTRWIIIAALTLSACSDPEAPEWLTEYQETGKTCAERPEGCTEDPPAPDILVSVDDTSTPDADTGPVCGDVEIPCNGLDDDCDPLSTATTTPSR